MHTQLMAAQVSLPLLRDGAVTLKIFIILLLTRNQKCRSTNAYLVTQSQKCYVSRQDILAACNRQKCGKAAGPDNITTEAFIISTNKQLVKLHMS